MNYFKKKSGELWKTAVAFAVVVLFCGGTATNVFSGDRGESITIVNDTGENQVIYFQVDFPAIPDTVKAAYGKLAYPCTYPDNPYSGNGDGTTTCYFTLPNGKSQAMPLTGFPAGRVSCAFSAGVNHFPKGPCNTTQAEFTLNKDGLDSYDISLVNGRSFDMTIAPANGQTISLGTKDPRETLGVYPVGCSRCVDGIGLAPAFQGNGTTTQDCPGYGRPAGPMPPGSCKTGGEFTPQPNACEIDSVPTGGTYTVTFNPPSI